MTNENAVANPPPGGPQEQASTNDQNENTVLRDKPWVVTYDAHGQVGVVGRFASQADATALAAARRETAPHGTSVTVVKENDTTNGLPALVAEKEGEEFGLVEAKPATKSAPAKP